MISQAYIFGSIGKAAILQQGTWFVVDADDPTAVRPWKSFDQNFFSLATPETIVLEGGKKLADVQKLLATETYKHEALSLALRLMDEKLDGEEFNQTLASLLERHLSKRHVLEFVENRLLSTVVPDSFNPAEALAVCKAYGHEKAINIFHQLNSAQFDIILFFSTWQKVAKEHFHSIEDFDDAYDLLTDRGLAKAFVLAIGQASQIDWDKTALQATELFIQQGYLQNTTLFTQMRHTLTEVHGVVLMSNFSKKVKKVIPYALGLAIIAALFFYVPIDLLSESLALIGGKVFLVFAVAILWIMTNTLCTSTLVRGKVPFLDLLYNNITGEAYNTILPLASVGGEPIRIQHMTNWLDLHTASRAVVVERLIRGITEMLFAAVCLTLTLLFVDMSSTVFTTVAILAAVHYAASLGIIWLSLSHAPSKMVGFVLKKFKMLEEYRSEPIPSARFFTATGWKFVSRIFSLVEMYAIFAILGYDPSMADIITIAGAIAASASVFFMPAGLGVNELSIASALTILGYPAALIISFSVVRRASVIFWALIGVALHATVVVAKRVGQSDFPYQSAQKHHKRLQSKPAHEAV